MSFVNQRDEKKLKEEQEDLDLFKDYIDNFMKGSQEE